MGKGNEHWGTDAYQSTQHDWDEAQAAEEDFCARAALSIASDLERTDIATLNRFLEKHGLLLARKTDGAILVTRDVSAEAPF